MRNLYDAGLDILGVTRGIAAKTVSTTPTKKSQAAARTTSASVATSARAASQQVPPSPGLSSFITRGATETPPPPRLSSFVTQALADRTRPPPRNLNIAITRGTTTAVPGSAADKAVKAASKAMKSVVAQGKSVGQRLVAIGKRLQRRRPKLGAKFLRLGQKASQGSTKIKGLASWVTAASKIDDTGKFYAMSSVLESLKALADVGALIASSTPDGVAYTGNNPQNVSDGIDYLNALLVSLGGAGTDLFSYSQQPTVNTQPLSAAVDSGTAILDSVASVELYDPNDDTYWDSDAYNNDPGYIKSVADTAISKLSVVKSQAQAWMQQLPALVQAAASQFQQQMQSGAFDPGTGGGGGAGGDYGEGDPFADPESEAGAGESTDDWPEGDAALAEQEYAEQGGEAPASADPFEDESEAAATDEYAEIDSEEELTPDDDAYWQDAGADEESLFDSDLEQSEDIYPEDLMGMEFKWQYILAPWMASQDKNAEDDKKRADQQAAAQAAAAAAEQAKVKHEADVAAAAASVTTPSPRVSRRVGRAKQALAHARARQAQYEAWRAQEIMDENASHFEEE